MTYYAELEVAVAAAREAGLLLQQEFHRPGGPRGHGSHAEIDAPAEEVIHRALSRAYPGYGYLGEELRGRATHAGPDGHVWIVDPNDGTSSYLKGYRGSSVSIALVREGAPVLGVVFAPCAPDDDGDLLAWAEGCGPVTRNGCPVERSWPQGPSPEMTVLVSQSADRKPLLNATLAAPMRFRGLPSIAYRLALVAAGEGDAAASGNGPRDWDYAAGHALLRGAGADLWCRGKQPVGYDHRGHSCCGGNCIGTSSGVAAAMAGKRDLASMLSAHWGGPSGKQLCIPKPGRAVRDAGLLSRAQGCLLGQLAGDSLGSLVEFSSRPGRVTRLQDGGTWKLLAGQPTDDSEMALALARSLARRGAFDPAAVLEAYIGWANSKPFDIGTTTAGALLSRRPNPESQANGALMRVSPLGIFGALRKAEDVEAWARADAALTHPHPVCLESSAVYATAIAQAIRTGCGAREVYAAALGRAQLQPVRAVLEAAAERRPASYEGWVLNALQNAFYQLLHAESLAEGVIDSVAGGADTDTNAAIAGALLGAVYGRKALPAQWLDRVLSCRPLSEFGPRPRPEEYWPVDALYLAEALLLA